MAQSGTLKRTFGPVPFAAAAANIYTTPSALIYDNIKHIHVVNTTAGALPFTLFVTQATGAETAGKEFIVGQSVPANSSWDWYGNLKLTSADFLVGHAAVTMTIMAEGEQLVV
jgi:hypothetical protein